MGNYNSVTSFLTKKAFALIVFILFKKGIKMKSHRKRRIVFLILFFLAGCLFISSKDKNLSYEEYLIRKVFDTLKTHYAYSYISKNIPERAFDLFIDSIDGTKRFFLKGDIEELKKESRKIYSDEKAMLKFFTKTTNILYKRILESKEIASNILSNPLNFYEDETIELDPVKRDFPENIEAKKFLWKKLLKYEVITKLIPVMERKKTISYTPEDEENARKEVLKDTQRMIERRLNDKYLFNRFIGSIASSFDNHTEFFPVYEKEDFDINMTGTFEGIGAQLKEEGEYIKVQEIIPGGPAARQKLLKAGDIILKVAQSNQPPVDVVNMPVGEVVRLIRGKAGTEVRLTVRKPDGQIVVIPIIRGKVVLEESYAKVSLIRKDEINIGYIFLPSFYRDFKSVNSRNATEDVFLAIEALKNYDVKGIILDLRNNGGGSLEDAVRISGLFIPEGPIVQVKNNIGFTKSINDPAPECYYNGPLVVLVNEMSASASEILSAALQDYRRAIIVGSEKTFGKGTVQVLLDLGSFEKDSTNIPLGTLKVTVQKFYRINGDSTQKKGVLPDIILPSPYAYIPVGEDKLKYPLDFDTIKPAKFTPWTNSFEIDKIKNFSQLRIKTSPVFAYIDNMSKKIKEKNGMPYPLNIDKAREFYSDLKVASEEILKQQTNAKERLNVEWVDYRNQGEEEDSRIKHLEWIGQISKDIYIQEAVNIIMDMNKH